MGDVTYQREAEAWRRELLAAQEHAANVERIHAAMVARLEAWAGQLERLEDENVGDDFGPFVARELRNRMKGG